MLGGTAAAALAGAATLVTPTTAQAATGDAIRAGQTTSANRATKLVGTPFAASDSSAALLSVVGPRDGSSGHTLEAVNFGGGSAILASGTGPDPDTGVGGGPSILATIIGSGSAEDRAVSIKGIGFGRAIGVVGAAQSGGGIGLLGLADEDSIALKVDGKAVFSRSGKEQIPAGSRKAVVALPGVTQASLILATLQQQAAGFTVESAMPLADKFVIRLNKPAPAGGLPVAWFVVN